ncbi:MAG TPA: hypothetical protein VFN11_21310 [Ktedonobacterales bacterium]|nr:hypothetical protein [Ktedonobacterales bacterium]
MTELESAIQKLEAHGGYQWLLEGAAFWSVKQVANEFAAQGRQVSVSTVTRWFRDLPHTEGSLGRRGLSASRNDLIVFFASQMRT